MNKVEDIPEQEEKASEHYENSHNQHVSDHANLTNVQTHGGVHYHIHDAKAFQLPKFIPESEMNPDEKEAVRKGGWDQFTRRDRDEDTRIYQNAVRQRKRRKNDVQIQIVHYATLGTLFVLLVGSYLVALFMQVNK